MCIRTLTVCLPALMVTLACGRNAPDNGTPHNTIETGPAEQSDATRGSDQLVGAWELRSEPPQRFPGLQIVVSVDSVSESRYFGRLAKYLSGNVGQNPNDYEAFEDSITSTQVVTFTIPTVNREMLGILFSGTLTADSILLSTFVLGPDTLNGTGRRWFLVRKS